MASTSRISDAIQTLVGVFHEYASKDCQDCTGDESKEEMSLKLFKLSKQELKELVQKEMDMDHVADPNKLEELMKDLDDDGDGQVNFEEFVTLVVGMALVCNTFVEILVGEAQELQE